MLAEKLWAGLDIEVDGDRLLVDAGRPLTDEQRQYIRGHKPAIIRLSKAANHFGCDLVSLLDWYRDDLDMVPDMPSQDLAYLVKDFLNNRARYLHQRGNG